MGLRLFMRSTGTNVKSEKMFLRSWSKNSSENRSEVLIPNPNPRNFTIKRCKRVGDFTVVKIRYPDCVTYGGDKIAVYEESINTIKRAKILDPHFMSDGRISPVARFRGNQQGWQFAVAFAKEMS